MTPAQLAAFIKMTQSASVRGQIQEETPEGWELHIGNYEYRDCVDALRRFLDLTPPTGTRGPWINAIDIKTEVRKVRKQRTEKADKTFVPPDPDDVKGYIQALRGHYRALADGAPEPEVPQLEQRFRPETLLSGVFRDVAPTRTTSIPSQRVEPTPRQRALARALLERGK